MMRITEHGQHFYVQLETACTDIGMRKRLQVRMRNADYALIDSLPNVRNVRLCILNVFGDAPTLQLHQMYFNTIAFSFNDVAVSSNL